MFVKKISAVFASLFILSVSALPAGDSASFVDLGFSPDGGVYMFAQYGVQSANLKPWADLFVVDVARNDFISGGKISYTHDRPIVAGQDGSGALYRLIAHNAPLAELYGITFPNQGQPLYIALEGDPAWDGKEIDFRNFETGVYYRAALIETSVGSGESLASSFYISLTCILAGGEQRNYIVGTRDLKRPRISSYRIKKVLIAPPGDSLIFVIEMKKETENGPDIRYMVEALRLNQ